MAQELPESTTVLINSAGPVGMACALSLGHSGVKDVMIIDAVPQSSHTSRAPTLHAAILEALDRVECADVLTEIGIKAHSARYEDKTTELFKVDFRVEDILAKKLVEKSVRVRVVGTALCGLSLPQADATELSTDGNEQGDSDQRATSNSQE